MPSLSDGYAAANPRLSPTNRHPDLHPVAAADIHGQ